jgi:hypothetical protein
MEKNIQNIKGLARRVFKINWFSGRITREGKWIIIWSKDLIPRVVTKIHPINDMIYITDRRYLGEAKEFVEHYKKELLNEGEHVTLRTKYH